MIDVSRKSPRLRTATAEGQLICTRGTLERIRSGRLPKGDLYGTARAAGLLAAKRTPDLVPHCHPVAIDGMQIDFSLEESAEHGIMVVRVRVASIARTGPEVEAIMATMVTLGVAYDLLKPIEANMRITEVRLIEKTGGKTDPRLRVREGLRAEVVTCSDAVRAGSRSEGAAAGVEQRLAEAGVETARQEALPLESEAILSFLKDALGRGPDFIFTVGGVGAGESETVPEIVRGLGGRVLPGIGERMRQHGMDRTALAMFTRPQACAVGSTLIVSLPGSTSGAAESLDAVLPGLFQARRMLHKGTSPASGTDVGPGAGPDAGHGAGPDAGSRAGRTQT